MSPGFKWEKGPAKNKYARRKKARRRFAIILMYLFCDNWRLNSRALSMPMMVSIEWDSTSRGTNHGAVLASRLDGLSILAPLHNYFGQLFRIINAQEGTNVDKIPIHNLRSNSSLDPIYWKQPLCQERPTGIQWTMYLVPGIGDQAIRFFIDLPHTVHLYGEPEYERLFIASPISVAGIVLRIKSTKNFSSAFCAFV